MAPKERVSDLGRDSEPVLGQALALDSELVQDLGLAMARG